MSNSDSSDNVNFDRFSQQLQTITNLPECDYLAQLLWNRGIKNTQQLTSLFATGQHQPTSYLEFGNEIEQAITRINQAQINAEKVAVWGDWQVDSVISACILSEGLQDFFPFKDNLQFYFLERDLSCWGLNCEGIDNLARQDVSLIITVGIGSQNLQEIEYARSLGIDLIIIDRTPIINPDLSVVALLNPYLLPDTHPFYHVSEITIVYKLLEGLATISPSFFPQPVNNLLDLVALSLLATATENYLSADERYLINQGFMLIKQAKRHSINSLAQLGFSIGDRALDQNDGLGRKIQLISSISTDINFIVNLLTNSEQKEQSKLTNQAEQIYLNCLDLYQKMVDEARKIISNIDLSNTQIIVLTNTQWQIGILDLLAKIIFTEYNKPILFLLPKNNYTLLSIYGLNSIYLSNLVEDYNHLIINFAFINNHLKCELLTENIDLFIEIITQKVNHLSNNINKLNNSHQIDLFVTINQLDQTLYQQLKILEPYSKNNPPYQLLIQNCYLTNIFQLNLKSTRQNKQTRYKKTYFQVYDDSGKYSFDGVWHTHYAFELNQNDRFDLIGEIAYNTYKESYYFRVINCYLHQQNNYFFSNSKETIPILDYRFQTQENIDNISASQIINKCPHQWQEINQPYQTAKKQNQQLILSYSQNKTENIEKIWLEFIGYLKYLLLNDKSIMLSKFSEKLSVSQQSLLKILSLLSLLSINYSIQKNKLKLKQQKAHFSAENYHLAHQKFIEIIKQENLAKKYFHQIPIKIIVDNINND